VSGRRLGGLAALALTVGVLWFPAASSAELSCSFSAEDATLFIFVTEDDTGLISVSGDRIVVADAGKHPIECSNAPGGPSTHGVERIRIVTADEGFAKLQLAGGPFAPGLSLEPDGFPEIEIDWTSAGGVLNVTGTSGTDAFRWGANGGINWDPGLNGDRDVDVVPGGFLPIIIGSGVGGDDRLTPQARHIDGIPFEEGGAGNDRLRTGGGGGLMNGAHGRDLITGGGGFDLILGGPGHDRIRAGGDLDLVLAADHTRDFVSCGRGSDLARVDRRDVVKGCESVRLSGPARRAADAAQTATADPRAEEDRLLELSRLWPRLMRLGGGGLLAG